MKTKLLQNIQAVSTGHRVIFPSSIESISYKHTPEPTNIEASYGEEYRVDVRLGAVTYIDSLAIRANPEIIEHEKRMIGRHISEHVYGDVRRELIALLDEVRMSGDPMRSLKSIEMINHILDMMEY